MQKVVEEITNDSHKWQIVAYSHKLIDYKNPIFFYWLDFWIWYLIHKKWNNLGWKNTSPYVFYWYLASKLFSCCST